MNIVFEIFANNLLPVFLIIGVGALLGVTIRPNVKVISRVTFYALTPCIVFSSLVSPQLSGAEVWQIVAFAAAATLITAALAWLFVALLPWSDRQRRAFVLPVLIINSGNFGLSIVLFAFGAQAQAKAMVYFVTTAILATTIGVVIAAGGKTWRQLFTNVARVPIIYAALAAIVVRLAGPLQIPTWLMRPIDLLSQAAVPMMLLILGLQLVQSMRTLGQRLGTITLATAFRLVVAPLIAFALARIIPVQGQAFQCCMLQASTPSGVTSTILALEYDLEPETVTGTVFLSTLCSAFTLSVLISIVS